jgi:ankyrin repeat protein
LEKGVEIETKDDNGKAPLSWAAEEGHDTVVKLLLEEGANIGTKAGSGRTPLLLAAKHE